MTYAEFCAVIMLGALVFYAVLGGADFGAGVWDLFAVGPRAAEQRKLIERALAPVWEANHVWLIFIVTVMFTAFPVAFAAMMTALHVPLTLLLFGIVLRGSAFVFRQYGGSDDRVQQRWGRVFAIASSVSPLFLGAALAALSSGEIRVQAGVPTTGFFVGWLGWFPLSVGLLALSLFTLLAAVYLCVEAKSLELRDDFVHRGLVAQAAVLLTSVAAALTAGVSTEGFRQKLLGSWWSIPLGLAVVACALVVTFALRSSRLLLARGFAVAQVAFIVLGWGLAQNPALLAPDITIDNAAAPLETLRLLVPTVLLGALLLFPSLYFLLRVFKRAQ